MAPTTIKTQKLSWNSIKSLLIVSATPSPSKDSLDFVDFLNMDYHLVLRSLAFEVVKASQDLSWSDSSDERSFSGLMRLKSYWRLIISNKNVDASPEKNSCPKAWPKPCGWCSGHKGISKLSNTSTFQHISLCYDGRACQSRHIPLTDKILTNPITKKSISNIIFKVYHKKVRHINKQWLILMPLNCQLTDFEKLCYVMNAMPRNASIFELLNEETKVYYL